MIDAVSKLPHNVIWKWNQDELPGTISKIRISKWFPQSDLLRHTKVKMFITQGGLQSADVAITDAGVPLIGIPMLGDQWFNVEQYEYHNIGIKIDMDIISEEKQRNGIETVMKDKSHPKIKLFITQGGLQSTDETITDVSTAAGKPVRCRMFPWCRFRAVCAFQHPPCMDQAACERRGCMYEHKTLPAQSAPPAQAPSPMDVTSSIDVASPMDVA
ncbi:UDP-glucuronosyltransferase 3A1-like [Ostrinia furnacalis]|uniref:UDP-glucuronosyltransferase 3A1-like n=1 Tax=Ostrinia furnacalis TaxID=93504 RepID=UPI0010399336|nr:UDP-glucuronosyltransferase 3A1-like [Ostrinia furnacalis]